MATFSAEMHQVTCLLALFEFIFFLYQIACYLSRPADWNRWYYLVLLGLLIPYNILSACLPHSKIDIPFHWQNIIKFVAALLVSGYFPYYFYKAFGFKRLKFFAFWGSIIFLIVPYMMFFLIPYYMTGDLQACRKAAVTVSCLYTVVFAYFLTRAIEEKLSQSLTWAYKTEAFGIGIAVVFWTISLVASFFQEEINVCLDPIIRVHNGGEVVAVLSTNFALLAMTILFIRRREEYQIQHAQILQKKTQALEFANEEKNNVIINLAHKAKNPLTVINNLLPHCIDKHGEIQELKIMKYCVEEINGDVTKFFDLARIENGLHLYDNNRIYNFSNILGSNMTLFKACAKKKNIEIIENIKTGMLIQADPEAINCIISNLVENAIKFSPEGGRIEVTLSSSHERIQFSVIDTGIGIHPEKHCKIFDPYYQIKTEKKNGHGRGLGLAIVKRIVNSLDAKIQVISNPDVQPGTSIRIDFKIPVIEKNQEISEFEVSNKLSAEPEVEKPMAENETFDNTKPYILVVEDNITLLNWVMLKLKKTYNVYIAENGQQALEKLKTIKHLDLIISDIIMDGMDGFEFLQKVSQQKRLLHIPFIFITAKNNIRDKIQGLTLGAIGYVTKPFQLAELTARIASILKIMEHQRNAHIFSNHKTLLNSKEKKELRKQQFENNCNKFSLTTRQVQIARLMSKVNTYKEIAETLFISENTVKRHVANIFTKTGCNSKFELLNILKV